MTDPQVQEYRRQKRAEWRDRLRVKIANGLPLTEYEKRHRKHNSKRKSIKRELCARANRRGKAKGLAGVVHQQDIYWPAFCPVLNLELDYSTPKGQRSNRNPALPSLDRWDNTLGYTPENVRVISLRANQLKNNATIEELEAVLRYMKERPWNPARFRLNNQD
jgi:hypothetical protein